MPRPTPLKSLAPFLQFWLEAFKEALKWGWGASGAMSLLIPDIIIALGNVDRIAHLAFIKWVSENPNLTRLYCVATVILAYLIYAPYRKYKETQIHCAQQLKQAGGRLNFIVEERGRLQAQLDDLQRPKLVLLEQRFLINTEDQPCFTFLLKNTGPGTVKFAIFAFAIQTTNLAGLPSTKETPTNQPIIEETTRRLTFCFPSMPPDPAYIVFHATYVGEDQRRWQNYPVFLGFNGVKKNSISSELNYLTNEEIAGFTEYLVKHKIPDSLASALSAGS